MKKEGKRRALSALVCGSMLTVALVGGTLAYLTDAEGAFSNQINAGEVDIVLTEKAGINGTIDYNVTINDEEGAVSQTPGYIYSNVVPGDRLTKEISVKNNGSSDAYVRVFVTVNNALEINKAIDEKYEALGYNQDQIQAVYDEVFSGWGLNYSKDLNGDGANDAGMRLTITGEDMPEGIDQVDSVKTIDEYAQFYSRNWFGDDKDVVPFDEYYTSGMNAYELKYVYYAKLGAGESVTLFDGLNVPTYFDNDQMKMFEGLQITARAEAIQAAGFNNAHAAFLAFDAQSAGGTVLADATVSSTEELDAAIKADKRTIHLKAGSYVMPDSAAGKELTLEGEAGAVLTVVDDGAAEGDCDYSAQNGNITFKDITIETATTYFPGYARLKATYNNCIINGTYTLYDESTFNNCTFNVSGDSYNVWTWGAPNATFNDCVFNSDGKAVLLYGGVNTHLSIENCVFNDNGTISGKAAIEIGNDYNKNYELNVSNTVVNGFDVNPNGTNTGTTLWANKNSMGTDKLNVVVDGVDVY